VAGLTIEVTHAPSDADDSVTFWFKSLGVAVHNLVWPVLFNIFAIRGEEYRDPQVLIRGVDHLLSLKAEHLVAAHGPPMSGATEIAERVTKYRDALQFIWDQSVRFINKGFTAADVGHLVNLPPDSPNSFGPKVSVVWPHTSQKSWSRASSPPSQAQNVASMTGGIQFAGLVSRTEAA